MSSAEQAVSRYVQDPTATVSVSAFTSAGLTWFGPLLRALSRKGDPRLVFHDRDVGQNAFPALTADYDLVIAHRLAHSNPWPDTITALPLVCEPLDVAMSERHRLAVAPSVGAADLRGEEWVSVQESFPLESALQAIAVHAGEPLNITHRINEFFIAAAIVAAGSAITLMPRHTAPPLSGSGMVLKPLHDLPLARHVDILCRPEALHRTAVHKVAITLQHHATTKER
ncbi:LysR family transcriptional regulator substrate-binding protein [Arthrobacter sp. Ld5]|uniref:LysR family transcriptional regulator substrate-binding protein n=1 Tax=Arthrobacter sp. Ld5 TaxID=649152 RepID=UPI003EB8E7C5